MHTRTVLRLWQARWARSSGPQLAEAIACARVTDTQSSESRTESHSELWRAFHDTLIEYTGSLPILLCETGKMEVFFFKS